MPAQPAHFDAIVIGAGANGSASAYGLARAGARVLLLEQFALGHERGSSHGDSRIIRKSYEHPDYVRLVLRAYTAWLDLEAEAGERVLHRTGGLDLAASGNANIGQCVSSLTELGVEHELLDSDEVMRRFPQFRVPDGWLGLWQPDAGLLHASRAVRLLAEGAVRHEAVLRENTPVDGLEVAGSGVAVRCGAERFTAAHLVVAAGAWVNRVLEPLGLCLPVEVSQEQWAHFPLPDAAAYRPGRFPVFIDYEHGPYGFPEFGRPGLKAGLHHGGLPAEADTRSFTPDPAGLARLGRWVADFLPGVSPTPSSAQTCLYTNTPGTDFVLDRVPGRENAIVVSACSGHGFKFAAETGRMVSDLLLGNGPVHPRFALPAD